MILPNLQTFRCLRSFGGFSSHEIFIKFLENNEENLTDFYVNDDVIKWLNPSIIRYGLNLKELFAHIGKGGSDVLKNIFNSCQYLESIEIWCNGSFSSCIDVKGML